MATQGHHTSDDQPAVPFGVEMLIGLMAISVYVLMGIVRCVREVANKETISFAMSVCLSFRIEKLGSHWMDFHEI
jgi:hypothetical protein